MESKDDEETNEFDEIIDEVNEYSTLYGYINNCGLVTENELTFNGDVELAKKHEAIEAASALLGIYNTDETNIDLDGAADGTTEVNIENFNVAQEGKDGASKFSLPRYIPPKLQVSTFQIPREPRVKYLLRSFKLWQEFRNSGDMERLKILFNDMFADDCSLFSYSNTPPIKGPRQLYEQEMVVNRNVPDFCIFFNNIVRTKRRLITCNCNSFGTLPSVNASTNNRATSIWNMFEYTPIDKLDEHHKLQKQKYDTLKSQNKVIRFETRFVWAVMLNRDIKQISKSLMTNSVIDIY